MTARGDFHGEASPVRDLPAYLFRTATNLWLDIQRRGKWLGPTEEEADRRLTAPADADPAETADALTRAASLTSAQEFAAIILKDVYDYALVEIADFVGTTEGTIKSALSRARRKMRLGGPMRSVDEETAALVRAFVDAMNARDAERILGLMSETVKIDVCNVGGGRGRSGVWTERTLAGIRCQYAEYEGAPLVLLSEEGDRVLVGAVRLEAAGGAVIRIVDYHYAAETLRRLASGLGLQCRARGYHQPSEDLPGMIETTGLPWRVRAGSPG